MTRARQVANLSPTIPDARMPNLTGDVTTVEGAVATTITAGAVDLAHMSSESVDEDNLHISNAGSNGEFLSKQSGNAGGLTWAAAGGGGKLLQVQYISHYGQVSLAPSQTYVSAFGSEKITITKVAGSNILLHWSTQVGKHGSDEYVSGTKIQRSTVSDFASSVTDLNASSTIAQTEKPGGSAVYTASSASNYVGNLSHTTIDTTLTASAGTYYYRVQMKSSATGSSPSFCLANVDNGVGIMYAMEIAT